MVGGELGVVVSGFWCQANHVAAVYTYFIIMYEIGVFVVVDTAG